MIVNGLSAFSAGAVSLSSLGPEPAAFDLLILDEREE
jgi:hypothetical protein